MNTRTLGDTFIEARKDRNKSEVREFQQFRNDRDFTDVADGNRRVKKYKKKGHMRPIIQHEYGRKSKYKISMNFFILRIKDAKSNFEGDNDYFYS